MLYQSNTWEKTCQVESVEHIEQYHIKFGYKSHCLKRRGRKASCCFPGHNLHVGVTVLRTLSAISFFPSDKSFYIFKKLKRIICTIFLCNKKYRSPCLFKRKGALISLSSLLGGKSLTFCTSTRSCARANDANSVRSRDAQCNTEESP